MVSMEILSGWGKGVAKKIEDALPEKAIILRQQDNMERAVHELLVWHETFDVIADGEKIPRCKLALEANTAPPKPKLIFNH